MLTAKRLHRFEIAALANLCPETADEAKGILLEINHRVSYRFSVDSQLGGPLP